MLPLVGALAVSLGAATVLAGCSGPALEGPAGFGGEDGTLCAGVRPGGRLLFGDVLHAPASAGLEILAVTLDEPQGVELERSFLMPIEPGAEVGGIGSATVPPEDPPPGWDERVAAASASLEPGAIGDIVVQVKRVSDGEAGFAAIHLTYRVGDVVYEKSATTAYQLRGSCL
jgi:hypothetical protein